MISKKDLLIETNISYGQLYRWKREGLIPDNWFIKKSVSSGQETYFDEHLIIPRVNKILELKDKYQFDQLREMLNPLSEKRIYSIRELLMIDEIDPVILKTYNQNCINKDKLNGIDATLIFILSKYKDYFEVNDYLDFHITNIENLNYCFYVIRVDANHYIIVGDGKELLDKKLVLVEKIKVEDVVKRITERLG